MASVVRLKARPTTYLGIKMRSRLEAHVAATLDELGIPWKYEPECFASRGGQYLPDFQLWPETASWYLEAKPPSLHEDNSELLAACQRMEIIRASKPESTLVLWMYDQALESWGSLVTRAPSWEGWRDAWAKPWLRRLASVGHAAIFGEVAGGSSKSPVVANCERFQAQVDKTFCAVRTCEICGGELDMWRDAAYPSHPHCNARENW